jgi:hypothetical protein
MGDRCATSPSDWIPAKTSSTEPRKRSIRWNTPASATPVAAALAN